MLFLGMLCAVPGDAQSGAAQTPAQREANAQVNDESELREKALHDMAKKASQERQAALKKDTEHLLKLAIELKGYVDKSNENVLSLDVIKKADEIEKLAHSVKEKMKGPN